jgi:NAD(P)-dependent dehydrogenase (short-subunit alcohol dehydrogenase family)
MEQKQVVLYTSGLDGLGLGLAKACIAKDAEVAAFGRSVEALEEYSCGLPNALAIRADATDH